MSDANPPASGHRKSQLSFWVALRGEVRWQAGRRRGRERHGASATPRYCSAIQSSEHRPPPLIPGTAFA